MGFAFDLLTSSFWFLTLISIQFLTVCVGFVHDGVICMKCLFLNLVALICTLLCLEVDVWSA